MANDLGFGCAKAGLCGIWLEVSVRALLEDHVSPPPRLIVDQSPFMSCASVILRDQNFAGMDGERLASNCRKFQHAGQSDDVLRDRVVMPIEVRVRRRLL